MAWKIEYDARVLKDLKKLDKKAQIRILKYIDNLAKDPTKQGKNLKSNFSGLRRYRVGNYRIICRLEKENLLILVLKIAHRKEVYR